jgi:hypothetical protein
MCTCGIINALQKIPLSRHDFLFQCPFRRLLRNRWCSVVSNKEACPPRASVGNPGVDYVSTAQLPCLPPTRLAFSSPLIERSCSATTLVTKPESDYNPSRPAIIFLHCQARYLILHSDKQDSPNWISFPPLAPPYLGRASNRAPSPTVTMTEVSATRLYLGNLPREGPYAIS